MRYQPERALTRSERRVVVRSLLRRNEVSAREGIDTSLNVARQAPVYYVEMRYQPERALTRYFFYLLASLDYVEMRYQPERALTRKATITFNVFDFRRNEVSAREGIDTLYHT